MKNLKNKMKENKAITLISLVITIVILIILAGIAISTMLGNDSLLNRTKTATEEYNKQTATESINLKITTCQMNTYAETQRMPTLKELAVELEKDNEIQYVNGSKRVASTQDINFTTATSIFTKLKAYPYEFEINSSLQLASIDGIQVASIPANDDDTIVSMTKKELRKMIQDEISAATPSTNTTNKYSISEQVVGTWIDGKPLYQKTLVSNMPDCTTDGTSVFKTVSIGAAVDYGMILNCAIENPYSTPAPSWYAIPFNDKSMNYFNINNNYNTNSQNTLRIGNSTKNFNGAKIIVTIQYTKTTDPTPTSAEN